MGWCGAHHIVCRMSKYLRRIRVGPCNNTNASKIHKIKKKIKNRTRNSANDCYAGAWSRAYLCVCAIQYWLSCHVHLWEMKEEKSLNRTAREIIITIIVNKYTSRLQPATSTKSRYINSDSIQTKTPINIIIVIIGYVAVVDVGYVADTEREKSRVCEWVCVCHTRSTSVLNWWLEWDRNFISFNLTNAELIRIYKYKRMNGSEWELNAADVTQI